MKKLLCGRLKLQQRKNMPNEGNKDEIVMEEVELADGTKINVMREDKFNEFKTESEAKFNETKTGLEEELVKEKDKGKNFAALRKKKLDDLSDEQKEKLSDEKKDIMEMREQYDKDRAEDKKVRAEGWKTAAYQELGIMDAEGKVIDEDAHKRLDATFSRFNDPEDSAQAVLRKAKSAWSLEFGNPPRTGEHAISSAVPFGGSGPAPVKSKEMNDNQKALAGFLGIDLDPGKKDKE